jgi:hypothetical protein
MKRAGFLIILVCIVCFACEVGLHTLYVVVKGRFVWEREEFRVRDFTQRVDDDRYITGKANYRNAGYTEGTSPWEVELDSHGFRAGFNMLAEQGQNIVFIGDSVPFGYGVDSSDTVPSLLQEILRRNHDPRGVVNAALPSYSLDQAVHRYKYELAGRYRVDVVILQVYDPASQFAQLGREWDVSKNWTTTPVWERFLPILRYSAVWHGTYYYLLPLIDYTQEHLRPSDDAAMQRYVNSINASLDVLAAEAEVRQIFLLPATLPPKTWRTISEPLRVALIVLNQTLRTFSGKHPNMTFLDTNALFSADEEGRGFIDDCCHLSRDGAVRVATVVAGRLLPSNR